MSRMELRVGVAVLVKRARWLGWLLPGHVVLAALVIAENAFGDKDAQAANPLAMMNVAMASNVTVVTLFTTLFLSAMWIYRANANLHAAGSEGMKFTPGWAVGWFFVPIANLVRPLEAMREIWTYSRLEIPRDSHENQSLLSSWWGCWVTGNCFFWCGAIPGDSALAPVRIIGEVALLVSALLFVRIIGETTRMQNERLLSNPGL